MTLPANLGVQSWCFRHFKQIPDLIAQIQSIGLSQVELCEVHSNFSDESTFPAVIEAFKNARIEITSIGVQTFTGNAQVEEKWFRFCALSGAKIITANIDVNSMPVGLHVANQLAEKHNIRLALHNHGGYHWLGNSQMMGSILQHVSPHVGLCLDTAWCLQSAEDPLRWAEKFADRLYAVHLKDFVFDRAGKWQDVIVGTGNLQLPKFLQLLAKAPKLATLTVEYEADVENPAPKLKQCVDQIRAAMS